MFRMHGPQWNNTRIILTDARYPAIDAFYLVRTGGNLEEDLDFLPVDVVEGFWKGDCDLRFVVDEVYDTSARLPGSKVRGDTGVCGAGVRCNGLIGGAAVLPAANGKIRTAKQLPEVSRTAVWGRAALYMAGASCDWWGGNIEKLIRQIA
jgi:hypothetical protein